MRKQSLDEIWLTQFLNRYSGIMVMLVTCIDRQRKSAENQELFIYYLTKLINYIIENNIKSKNIYSNFKTDFLIDHNQYRQAVECKSHKQPLEQYYSQGLIIVIERMCEDVTKLPPLVIL